MYRSSRREGCPDDLIDVVIGAEPIAERVGRLHGEARTEYLGFATLPLAVTDFEFLKPARNRALPARIIYQDDVLGEPGAIAALRAIAKPDERRLHDRLRTHPALPMKLFVVDRRVAVLPLTGDDLGAVPAVVLVHPSGLLDAVLALFENYWAASRPLDVTAGRPVPARTAPTGTDLVILSLLMSGATDEATARQLGISVRTIRRRVQAMMAAAGVNTRIQLGWHAATEGWLRPGHG